MTNRFARQLPHVIRKLKKCFRKMKAHCNNTKKLSTSSLNKIKKQMDNISRSQSIAMLRLLEVRCTNIKHGKRVCVFFETPGKFYKGTVLPSKNSTSNKVRVLFDDGDDIYVSKTELYNIPIPKIQAYSSTKE